MFAQFYLAENLLKFGWNLDIRALFYKKKKKEKKECGSLYVFASL
jgi:hypothetical protein